jgi:hypothetical protein
MLPLKRARLEGASELTKTFIPVALVIGFGLVAVAYRPDFFWQDDYQDQYLPASREIARAVSDGEWPILTARNWFGASLAGEFQHGVFSLSTLLASWGAWQLGLSLPATAAALSLFHLAIAAAGAYRLARARKLEVSDATLVGVVAALNGWLIYWGRTWYPSVVGFAWVPWAWWALERALGPERRAVDVVLAGVFLYLVLAAGWPSAVLMVALVTVCLSVRSWAGTRAALAPWPALAAWLIALGLAAPSLLTFLEYGQVTRRFSTGVTLDHQWLVPLAGLRGLLLPAAHTFWRAYVGYWVRRPSMELAGGLVPACALGYAIFRRGGEVLRGARVDVAMAALALSCALLPSVRPLQCSFRWLPLVHLALALVGATCLHALRSLEPRLGFWSKRPRMRLALLASAAVAFLTVLSSGESLDPTSITRQVGMLTLVLALAWAAVELWSANRLGGWPTVAFGLASLGATYGYLPGLPDAPRWPMPESLRQNEPYRPELRYLSLYDVSELYYPVTPADGPTYLQGALSALRPGYTAMYSDLQFANGYSAMMPLGPLELFQFGYHGEIKPAHSVRLLHLQTGEGGLLDLMAIDGLVLVDSLLGEVEALTRKGWRTTAHVEGGTVLERVRSPSLRVRSLPALETLGTRDELLATLRAHRFGAVPVVRVDPNPGREVFATASLSNPREGRSKSRVDVSVPAGTQSALVLFSRPWLPGWRATLDGVELPVEEVDLLMPAVRVPPGAHGELTLAYRPRSLVRGAFSALFTVLAALAWLLWERRRSGGRDAAAHA